jgi:hypothetical protein
MKAWEAINLSNDDVTLFDLSDGEFKIASDDADSTDDMSKDALKPEQLKKLAALADRIGDKDVSDRDTLTEDDIAKLLGSDDDSDKDTSKDDDKEPVAALSKEAQEKIDLAEKNADKASKRADEIAEKLALSEWKQKRAVLLSKGVPKSMLDKAEPLLSKPSAVVELSRSDSEASIVMQMLHEAEGTIDFSERGSSSDEAEDDEKQAKELAKDEVWEKV